MPPAARGDRLQADLADLIAMTTPGVATVATPFVPTRRRQRDGARSRALVAPQRARAQTVHAPIAYRDAADARMTQLILFNVFNGLIVGAFYALMALGLSLILNLSGVINFAHGGFLALGAYFAYTLMPYLGFWGGLLVAPILTAMLGLLVERLLIRRLYGRDPLYSLLLTFGLAFIFQDVTRFIWGAQSVPYQIPGVAGVAALHRLLLPDRLSALHGGCWSPSRSAGCS